MKFFYFTGSTLSTVDYVDQSLFQNFRDFKNFSYDDISAFLVEQLESVKEGFLLPGLLRFIDNVRKDVDGYSFVDFQRWVNRNLSVTDRDRLKGKIVGRFVPRESYQKFLPIGRDYRGPCYSFAHKSPDIDTSVASFISFLNGYAASISKGISVWCVEGGLPNTPDVDFVFTKPLGKVFEILGKEQPDLLDFASNFCSQNLEEKWNRLENIVVKGSFDSITVEEGTVILDFLENIKNENKLSKKWKNMGFVDYSDFCRFYNVEGEKSLVNLVVCTTVKVALDLKKRMGLNSSVVDVELGYEDGAKLLESYSSLVIVSENKVCGILSKCDIVGLSLWNDFSNPLESPSNYKLSLISCIDHHKANLSTQEAIPINILNVGACCSILATLSMEINSKYSTGGKSLQSIEEEIAKEENPRVVGRLLNQKYACKGEYYVSPEREFLEYLQFLVAILDDTNLLTSNVCKYDLDAVENLLNRLVSIKLNKEVEVVTLGGSIDNMVSTLMENRDIKALCLLICKQKADATEKLLLECKPELFRDTKILGNVSVGQMKYYKSNRESFVSSKDKILELWEKRCNGSEEVYIFMWSTIPSLEEKNVGDYLDEIWYFSKNSKLIKSFLSKFREKHCNKIVKEEIGTIYVKCGAVVSRKKDVATCLE